MKNIKLVKGAKAKTLVMEKEKKEVLDFTSLSTLFGEPIEAKTGRAELLAFAAEYPLETTVHGDGDSVTFDTEDVTYEIRHDLNEELEVIFVGSLITYCPQITRDTIAFYTVKEALLELRAAAVADRKSHKAGRDRNI